ncbi:hypothetical protein APED_12460 [Acanthopleuribacter pedis]
MEDKEDPFSLHLIDPTLGHDRTIPFNPSHLHVPVTPFVATYTCLSPHFLLLRFPTSLPDQIPNTKPINSKLYRSIYPIFTKEDLDGGPYHLSHLQKPTILVNPSIRGASLSGQTTSPPPILYPS